MTARTASDAVRLARFMARFVVDEATGCHIWTAGFNNWGYGTFSWCPGTISAHRSAYLLFKGPIPDGLELDHLCRRTACVNPDHLEAVTQAENARRKIHVPRVECAYGHPFTSENTYSRGGRKQECMTCRRDALRKWRAAHPKSPTQTGRIPEAKELVA